MVGELESEGRMVDAAGALHRGRGGFGRMVMRLVLGGLLGAEVGRYGCLVLVEVELGSEGVGAIFRFLVGGFIVDAFAEGAVSNGALIIDIFDLAEEGRKGREMRRKAC